MDVCSQHGTWFDPGELPQVFAFVKSGGLVRERLREQERQRLAASHDQDRALEGQPPHASFDSLSESPLSARSPSAQQFCRGFVAIRA